MGIYEYDFDIEAGFSKYRIEHLHGKVIGSNKYSETVVTGGGTVRHNETISIRSRTYTHLEFCIKTEEGQEEDVKIVADIPIRDDHIVTLIRAVSDTNKHEVTLINHTLDKYYQIKSAKQLYVLNALYAVPLFLFPILYVRFLSTIGESALFDMGAWFIAILIGFIPGLLLVASLNAILRYMPAKKAKIKLEALTNELCMRYC